MTLETRLVLTREFSVIWDVLSQKKACIFWMQCVHIISHFRKSGETERRSCLSRGSCVNHSPSKALHTLPSSSHVFQLFWNILWLCGLGMIVMRAGSRSSELCLAPLAHPSLCMLLIFPPQKNSLLQCRFCLAFLHRTVLGWRFVKVRKPLVACEAL